MIFSSHALRTLLLAGASATIAAACGGATTDGGSQSPPGSSSSSGGTVTPPADGANAPKCDAAAARDIAVSSEDVNGYPPYAIAECSLVYVSSAGDLVLRDLVTSSETKLAPISEKPRRPSVAVDIDATTGTRHLVVAWETTLAQGPAVRVRYNDVVTTMRPGPEPQSNFVMAGEPRVRDHWVVFTVWNGPNETDDTDVWLYDVRTDKARMVFGGPAQQRFADVSSTHVVATDFVEDPDGHFDRVSDLADLIIYEMASEKITPRPAAGKQAFPMLSNSGALAYLEWTSVHPEPKLGAFDLKAGTLLGNYASDRLIARVQYTSAEPARPALAGDTLEWIGNPDGKTTMYRSPVDGSAPPTTVAGLDNLFLYAPAPRPAIGDATDFTVVATIDFARTQVSPRLRAVTR